MEFFRGRVHSVEVHRLSVLLDGPPTVNHDAFEDELDDVPVTISIVGLWSIGNGPSRFEMSLVRFVDELDETFRSLFPSCYTPIDRKGVLLFLTSVLDRYTDDERGPMVLDRYTDEEKQVVSAFVREHVGCDQWSGNFALTGLTIAASLVEVLWVGLTGAQIAAIPMERYMRQLQWEFLPRELSSSARIFRSVISSIDERSGGSAQRDVWHGLKAKFMFRSVVLSYVVASNLEEGTFHPAREYVDWANIIVRNLRMPAVPGWLHTCSPILKHLPPFACRAVMEIHAYLEMHWREVILRRGRQWRGEVPSNMHEAQAGVCVQIVNFLFATASPTPHSVGGRIL
jgi:hypothetical protein